MSYILDALRKSDQQRQRGATPTLLTAQATVATPTRSGLSLNGWLAATLVGAGVLIGWLRPWQTDPVASIPEPIAARPLAATPAMPALQPDMPSSASELEQIQQPGLASASTATPTPAQASAAKETKSITLAGHQTPGTVHAEATPVPLNSVVTDPAEVERGKNVMPLSELPPSIRQEIPNITISFHVYSSNPTERRVMINNELLRQGENLPPGLRVEQITPDGVIISYKGYRFQRGVRSGV
jgi:general secretion pathway protein B